MDPYFFRVEHDLVKSEAFKQLNGSAIKVYLVIGLYSDFGTGWAYPSIRTIAKQAGLSRQTVLNAIDELVNLGILATSKSTGRSTAYRILQNTPVRPVSKDKNEKEKRSKKFSEQPPTVPEYLVDSPETVLITGTVPFQTGPEFHQNEAQFWADTSPEFGPKQDNINNSQSNDNPPSIDIPGTPFRIDIDGQLMSVLSLTEVLVRQGISTEIARGLVTRYSTDRIIRSVLNAVYLDKQGRLQNAPGYLRMALEKGYELLPQVAQKLEQQRRLLTVQTRQTQKRDDKLQEEQRLAAEEAAISILIDNLKRDELERLIRKAVSSLPESLVKRNPSMTNPLIRARVYELATKITESN